MNEMIERVARALCQKYMLAGIDPPGQREPNWKTFGNSLREAVDQEWKYYDDEARAAIVAMRVPTEAMAHSGALIMAGGSRRVYTTMIDAALEDDHAKGK